MAAAETAKLLVSLEFVDRFSKGIGNASAKLGKFSGAVAKSRAVSVALGVGLERAVESGARATVGFIQDGIASLAELENVNAQTRAAIASTGSAAHVTAGQIRELSQALEDKTTIDDKEIQAAANLMLTFTKVRNEAGKGNDVFDQSVTVLTDMATALGGDVPSNAIKLGRALQDPLKGITALTRVGVTFSKSQVKRIKEFMKEGKVVSAQKIILAELTKEFGGSAAAAADTYEGKMRRLGDSVEGLQMAVATGLMPALKDIAAELGTVFKDPAVMQGVTDLGKGLRAGTQVRAEVRQDDPVGSRGVRA